MPVDVSIIIVNYNTKRLLADCLNSICSQVKGIAFEIIVSDNGSVDGSVEMIKKDFSQVILIENNANLGFGAANNRGLDIAKGKYVFYLNSDTALLNNAVKIFFDYFEANGEKENLFAIGCQLLHGDMEFAGSCGSFANLGDIMKIALFEPISVWSKAAGSVVFGRELKPLAKNELKKAEGFVDYIIGADLFLKNNDDARFDESFFMYYEEIDLQYKMRNRKKCKIIDGPKIIHLENINKVNYEVLDLGSFAGIHNRISCIYFLSKWKINPIAATLLKFSTLIVWLCPLLYARTRPYLRFIFRPKDIVKFILARRDNGAL